MLLITNYRKSTCLRTLVFILLSGIFLASCGGSGNKAKPSENSSSSAISSSVASSDVVPAPKIVSFTASSTAIKEGESTTLTAVFNDGLATVDNGVGSISSGIPIIISPTVTTTYSLNVSNSIGESVKVTLVVVVEPSPIKLSIAYPVHNQPVNDFLDIGVTVQSEFEIVSMVAVLSDKSVPLVYSERAVCIRVFCKPGFSGRLSLADLGSAFHPVKIIATDADGNVVSKQVSIKLDKKPELLIAELSPLTVATPSLPVDISCKDDFDNCKITISARLTGSDIFTNIASSTNKFIEVLDLSAFNGSKIDLHIEGKDGSDQKVVETKTVYVENSVNLLKIKDFAGEIVDYDGQRSLLLSHGTDGDKLSIYDFTSDFNASVQVDPNQSIVSQNSFLTPTGAMYFASSTNVVTRLFDWNASSLYDLGNAASFSFGSAGDYAIWISESTLWRRQLSTKENSRISDSAGNMYNALGPNGGVAYWSVPEHSIKKYSGGTTDILVNDSQQSNIYILTDGNQYVYKKYAACCGYAIASHNGIAETMITNFSTREPIPERDYAVNDGYIAYTDMGASGQSQVWTKDPDGVLKQRTKYSSSSYIDNLSSEGDMMIINTGKRYLSTKEGQLIYIGSSLGNSIKYNDDWYIYIGRSLFKVVYD